MIITTWLHYPDGSPFTFAPILQEPYSFDGNDMAGKKSASRKKSVVKKVAKKSKAKKVPAPRTLGKAAPPYGKHPAIIGSESTDTAPAPIAGQVPMTLNAPIAPVVVDERPKPAA